MQKGCSDHTDTWGHISSFHRMTIGHHPVWRSDCRPNPRGSRRRGKERCRWDREGHPRRRGGRRRVWGVAMLQLLLR